MAERQIFYLDVWAKGKPNGIKALRAKDLQTAQRCLDGLPGIIRLEQRNKDTIPEAMLAELTDPFDCPDGGDVKVLPRDEF